MNKVKQWIARNIVVYFSYVYWIRLRDKSKDEYGEKLCYCGHTHKCSCADPDECLFMESVRRGSIILGDENNGWKDAS